MSDDLIPPAKTLLARGFRRKCPQCGKGDLFTRWVKVREGCPHCGLKYLENQGDLWGGLLLADRVFFIIPLVVIFFLMPHGPYPIWRYIAGGLLVIVLGYTMPHRLGMALAMDYLIRRRSGDLAEKDKKAA